ncbi:ATP-binding cassette domain-containing protein [Synechococcus sp. H60.2]|uniref:ATP-binding cassette domain-containing protein n=1 Tax=Synechococcus sp. H60.2 TaxID=2964518 RepID=UPI0039C181E1
MLQVIDLEKRFFLHRLGREVLAFKQVSFSLQAGELLLLEGPNGAGKSSLLRTLYRSYCPTGGQILLQTPRGRVDLARLGDREILWIRREYIGYVSQFLDPRPRTTALELVAEPLLWRGVEESRARQRAAELLLELGLKPELLEAFPTGFSGGEKQKLNLARSLIHPYPLLLLDEPTASLDAGARKALRERLRLLKQQGTALVGVFHSPEDVAGLVDKTYHLEEKQDVAVRT